MKKGLLKVILTAILCLIFISCGAKKEEAKTNNGERGHLKVALYWFGETLDPANEWDGWTLTRVAAGETLVTIDENLNIVGQLADSWENVDEKTWKFHIRKGVTFQNGNPLTPEAVKTSIERSMKLNERGATTLNIDTITVDGENVIFKTKEPYGAFLANISEPLFIIVDTTADTSKFKETPVTTGPYKITSFNPGTSFEMEAYDNYWGGKPGLSGMTVFNIEDDNTRALALQSGDVDVAQGIRAANIALFTDNKDFNVGTKVGTRVESMIMNVQRAPLNDKNIRLALNAAVDYDTIAKVVGGGAVAAKAPFSPSTPYGGDKVQGAKYDVEKAKALLVEAGYKDTNGDGYVDKNGKNLEIEMYGTSAQKVTRANTVVAELLEAQLKEVGIKLNVNLAENVEDVVEKGNFDFFFKNIQTLSTGDPQWFLANFFTTNGSGNSGKYSDKTLDDLVEKLSVTFDVVEREKIAREASQLIINEGYGMHLISQSNVDVSSKKVENLKTFPIDYYLITLDTKIKK